MDAYLRLKEAVIQRLNVAAEKELTEVAAFILENTDKLQIQDAARRPLISQENKRSLPLGVDKDLNFIEPQEVAPKRREKLTKKDFEKIRKLLKGVPARSGEYRRIRDDICKKYGASPKQIGGALSRHRR